MGSGKRSPIPLVPALLVKAVIEMQRVQARKVREARRVDEVIVIIGIQMTLFTWKRMAKQEPTPSKSNGDRLVMKARKRKMMMTQRILQKGRRKRRKKETRMGRESLQRRRERPRKRRKNLRLDRSLRVLEGEGEAQPCRRGWSKAYPMKRSQKSPI